MRSTQPLEIIRAAWWLCADRDHPADGVGSGSGTICVGSPSPPNEAPNHVDSNRPEGVSVGMKDVRL